MTENPFQMMMQEEENGVDLKELLLKYLRFWRWFLIGLLLCNLFGFLYLRYTPPTYYSEAKIKILQEGEQNMLGLEGGSLLGGPMVNLQNEIEVLKSLDHPNIIKYYEDFENQKYYCIVMEFVQGETLLNYIKRKFPKGRKYSEEKVARLD